VQGGDTPFMMSGSLLGGTVGPIIVAQIVPLVGERAIMGIIGSDQRAGAAAGTVDQGAIAVERRVKVTRKG
jgi:hypothetical protein